MATKIAWTDSTWSPVTGCTKIAAGCKNCFADAMTRRFWKQWGCESPPNHFKVRLHPERLEQPLHWRKPRRIFVCSMSDLFHEQVPFAFVDRVFAAMINCKRHTYQLLTKRPQRALDYYVGRNWRHDLSHIHLGVSCSTQADLNRMAEDFFPIPAAVRFLSLEPLLEPIRLDGVFIKQRIGHSPGYFLDVRPGLHWCVIGCESGSGARPCKDEWVISIVNQCNEAIPRIPVFTKQLARDGKAWKLTEKNRNEWPDWAVQEYPI